jgi:hypothetical protein
MKIELYTPNGRTRIHIYQLTFSALRTTVEIILTDPPDLNAVSWAEQWLRSNGLRWHMLRIDPESTRRAQELGSATENGMIVVNSIIEIAHRIRHPEHPGEISERTPFSADEYWTDTES